jgi:F-type H+-transporting ATPase subunit epsilon
MQLQLITPEKIVLDGEVAYVGIPGTEGDFGVMPGHEPFVSTLRAGTITIEMASGDKQEFVVSGGIAEIVPERCTLLVEAD